MAYTQSILDILQISGDFVSSPQKKNNTKVSAKATPNIKNVRKFGRPGQKPRPPLERWQWSPELKLVGGGLLPLKNLIPILDSSSIMIALGLAFNRV